MFSKMQRSFVVITMLLIIASFMRMLAHYQQIVVYNRRLEQSSRPNKTHKFAIRQHGQYWILYNYITAEYKYKDNESITFTTHGEYRHLLHLEKLVERWRAPVSITLYAPGADFEQTLKIIRFMYDCSYMRALVRQLVTFHICLSSEHMPTMNPNGGLDFFTAKKYVCENNQISGVLEKLSHRQKLKLPYPVNLLRNVARLTANTYFVLPLDFDILPPPYFVPRFLKFIKYFPSENPYRSVYCMPKFLLLGDNLPSDKYEVKRQIELQMLVPYNTSIKKPHYQMPFLNEWLGGYARPRDYEIAVSKKIPRFAGNWAPLYVTVNDWEPLYDERFTIDDIYDLIAQADLLTLMKYDFFLLDFAFLVHRSNTLSVDTLQANFNLQLPNAQGMLRSSLHERNILYQQDILPMQETNEF